MRASLSLLCCALSFQFRALAIPPPTPFPQVRDWIQPSETVQQQIKSSRSRNRPVTDAEREIITGMTSESPLEATKHLIWVARASSYKIQDFALHQLLSVE